MRKTSFIVGVLVAAVIAWHGSGALAQTTRPALSQLDAELRSLYADVADGTVRVQLPVPSVARLGGPDDHWLRKWGDQIDPRILRQLEQRATSGPAEGRAQPDRPGQIRGEVLQDALPLPGHPNTVMYLDDLADRMIAVLPREGDGRDLCGVLFEGGNHVVIPAYVTAEEIGGRPLRVTAGDEQIDATFVGSDRQTNVSVLKLSKPYGKALAFADAKPAPGSVVLMLSPARRGAKLTVWSGGHDDHAVVIDVSGRVAAFARPGQVLAGEDLRHIASEIVKHGKVKRAQLGVMIAQVQTNDPLRQQVPLLGARPALRVGKVLPQSAAAAGGLKVGDLILSLAGEPVEDLPTFAAAISSHSGPTELKVIREGKEAAVTVNLEPK